ncbi:hypothetical protein Efla_006184 [Eimeria flavescens]
MHLNLHANRPAAAAAAAAAATATAAAAAGAAAAAAAAAGGSSQLLVSGARPPPAALFLYLALVQAGALLRLLQQRLFFICWKAFEICLFLPLRGREEAWLLPPALKGIFSPFAASSSSSGGCLLVAAVAEDSDVFGVEGPLGGGSERAPEDVYEEEVEHGPPSEAADWSLPLPVIAPAPPPSAPPPPPSAPAPPPSAAAPAAVAADSASEEEEPVKAVVVEKGKNRSGGAAAAPLQRQGQQAKEEIAVGSSGVTGRGGGGPPSDSFRLPPLPEREPPNPPAPVVKTDLLAKRVRTKKPSNKGELILTEPDDDEEGLLPPYKGAEELFAGGVLMALSGLLQLQGFRSAASSFVIIVFSLMGALLALFGVVSQITSRSRRKQWIQKQGSLLDHLKN